MRIALAHPFLRILLGLLAACAGHPIAQAHKPSDSYLTLTAREGGVLEADWHVALRDLDAELQLDANDDGRLTWGEVRTRWDDIVRFARPHLLVQHAGHACLHDESVPAPALAAHTDGRYAAIRWTLRCPVPAAADWLGVNVRYSLFAVTDPTHRGIVHWATRAADTPVRHAGTVVLGEPRPSHTLRWPAWPTSAPRTAQTSPDATLRAEQIPPTAPAAPQHAEPDAAALRTFVADGMHHIAIGTDHVLFLMSLLLVSVWRRPAERATRWWPLHAQWQPVPRGADAVREAVKLVTAFTVAHSLTLGLAATGVLSPPSRWVESLIAFSVLLAALDNMVPLLRGPRWRIVFAFGLVHGFGFAGALQDLGLNGAALAWPLLGFNLGVEAGQLALVAVTLPLACLARRTAAYRGVVALASIAIALLALVWCAERVLDVRLLG